MATYSDIIKFEEEAGEGVIRLIKSGGFYRAYNHSAWLFQCCITEHKVIRRYVKSLERNIYYIGFPDKNLFANIGERESEKTELYEAHIRAQVCHACRTDISHRQTDDSLGEKRTKKTR